MIRLGLVQYLFQNLSLLCFYKPLKNDPVRSDFFVPLANSPPFTVMNAGLIITTC